MLFVQYTDFDYPFFLEPGDSLVVDFRLLANPDTIRTMNFTIVNDERTIFSGNNKPKFSFFDTLERKLGTLADLPFKLELTSHNFLAVYKRSLDSLRNARLLFLSTYIRKYKLSDAFRRTATYEIEGSFLYLLQMAIFYRGKTRDFSDNYFSEINKQRFSWDQLRSSRTYSGAFRMFIGSFLGHKLKLKKREELPGVYRYILRSIFDDSLRNYGLTSLITNANTDTRSEFRALFKNYLEDCTNKHYINAVRKKFRVVE